MKKLLFGTMLLALVLVFPITTMAMGRVDVGVSIPLPPPILFAAPPFVVVIPETYVYAVPDVDTDIFFFDGWWWRPWEGRWYRSRDYGSGWGYYDHTPSFHGRIPSGWRNDYREHRWKGQHWNHQRIPHQQVQQNWSNWKKNRHWEKKNTWGVQSSKPRPDSRQHDREVQPQHREIQQPREAVKPQRSQPRSTPRPDSWQHDRKVQPQHREIQQPREAVKPQQSRKAAKPKHIKRKKVEKEQQNENEEDRHNKK